jgi:hypothetical protein
MGVTTLSDLRSNRAAHSAAALLAISLLASCSGGGGGPTTATQSKHKAILNIKIAGSGTQSKLRKLAQQRHTKYVSVATNGLAIYAYPASQSQPSTPTIVADVSSSSQYCTAENDGSGDRVCGIPVAAPTGTDDFVIDGYDEPPSNGQVQGNELEVGTALDVQITSGAANQVNVTFDGIVASIQIAPVWMTSQDDGNAHAYTFVVNAADADGYQIIDVTPFVNPLSISIQNDPNKTLSITPPAQGTDPRIYTLNYNGGVVNDAQVVASVSGVSATTTLDFTPIIVTPQTLTLSLSTNPSGTFTAQMAVPADQTAGQASQFWSSASENTEVCQITAPDGTFGPAQAPWTNGNPVTFTVSAQGLGTTPVYVQGPITNSGLAQLIFNVTVNP